MQKKTRLTENQMAIRILNREDNPIYKQQMIRNILNMYSDEIRKAMLNGESVQISGVGTLIPEVKVHEGKYNMPICNKTDGNPPPFTKIRVYRNYAMETAMNSKLMNNIKNGIWGLKKRLFNESDFEFLKDAGYIPEDAELPNEGEEQDLYGRVTRYFHDRGFGFIQGEDGNVYYIHHSKLYGEYLDRGYYVHFKTFQNDRSDLMQKM